MGGRLTTRNGLSGIFGDLGQVAGLQPSPTASKSGQRRRPGATPGPSTVPWARKTCSGASISSSARRRPARVRLPRSGAATVNACRPLPTASDCSGARAEATTLATARPWRSRTCACRRRGSPAGQAAAAASGHRAAPGTGGQGGLARDHILAAQQRLRHHFRSDSVHHARLLARQLPAKDLGRAFPIPRQGRVGGIPRARPVKPTTQKAPPSSSSVAPASNSNWQVRPVGQLAAGDCAIRPGAAFRAIGHARFPAWSCAPASRRIVKDLVAQRCPGRAKPLPAFAGGKLLHDMEGGPRRGQDDELGDAIADGNGKGRVGAVPAEIISGP